VPDDDLEEILSLIDSADKIVLHNGKFDALALDSVLRTSKSHSKWVFPFGKMFDTIIADHLILSNSRHGLDDLALRYLSFDMTPFEEKVKAACIECRRRVKSTYCSSLDQQQNWWNYRGGSQNPRANVVNKGSHWKADMWIPRTFALRQMNDGLYVECSEEDKALYEEWLTVLSDYANVDTTVTLEVWKRQEIILKENDLWEIFLDRMRLPEIVYHMEKRGVAASQERTHRIRVGYENESISLAEECISIADECGYPLDLPESGANNSLKKFIFDILELPILKKTPTGQPSLDKDAMVGYADLTEDELNSCHEDSQRFMTALIAKRSCDTALTYLNSYTRMWRPVGTERPSKWMTLHPSLNITGTATLRWSCELFNEQNLSKKKGFNLRECFGPLPGREWWSLDAQNIELRIPAFESGEATLIDVFLRPTEAPYYGSYHLVVFDALYPELFAEHGVKCKDLFEDSYYQWVKNGNFAMIYGAQESTADRTYHMPGAYQIIRNRFPNIAKLNDRMMVVATEKGYVETIPDRSVNARRGYPIQCLERYGMERLSPTVPLNYHIQSTAMQWMAKAMMRTYDQLTMWRNEGYDGWICMQVHDELVFDLPKRGCPVKEKKTSNLARIKRLQKLMEQGGDDIGIPTPVALEYNPESWDKGVRL